jgi:uncharacterized protein
MSRSSDFHIDRQGVWRYRGSIIEREAMVRLFAGMLQKRGADYVLQTPEQVLRVRVDDAPFVITDMECSADGDVPRIWMITNLGERFLLGREHPLYLREDTERGEVRAYQLVRNGMPALVHRNVFYRMAELARIDRERGKAGVRSDGIFFALE